MYDVIVCGSGAAGLTAAIYCARSGLKTLIIGEMIGGQTLNAHKIENYPGIIEIDGFSLMENFRQQAEKSGAEMQTAQITQINLQGKKVNGIAGKTIILAMGAKHRSLGLEKEAELTGRGISYCAACDGNFFRGKTVAVVGGGNTAVSDAIYLSNICQKVIIIHRRSEFRAEKSLVEMLKKCKNIELVLDSTVQALLEQDGKLIGIHTQQKTIPCDGLFIAIGTVPNTQLIEHQIRLENGVPVNMFMETSIPGVFAAGDITDTNQKQVITAAGDGAKAAKSVLSYLQTQSIL